MNKNITIELTPKQLEILYLALRSCYKTGYDPGDSVVYQECVCARNTLIDIYDMARDKFNEVKNAMD